MSFSGFVSESVPRTSVITLDAPPDRVFPPSGPVREKEWAFGWEPRMLDWNEANKKAQERMFLRELKDWDEAIDQYLKTGERLTE